MVFDGFLFKNRAIEPNLFGSDFRQKSPKITKNHQKAPRLKGSNFQSGS